MSFKGQNSLEYLSTYGWMLVVVAIATGIFYTNYVPEEQCNNRVISSMPGNLAITDLATDPQGDLALLIRNEGARSATVQEIVATAGSNTTTLETNNTIPTTDSEDFRLNGTSFTEDCTQVDVEVIYDSPQLGTVSDRATIKGKFTVVS